MECLRAKSVESYEEEAKKMIRIIEDNISVVDKLVDEARNKMEVIGPHIQPLQKRAERIFVEAERTMEYITFLKQGFMNSWCPKFGFFHSVRKKVFEMREAVTWLEDETRHILQSELRIGSVSFQSDRVVITEILSCLKSENTDVVGICGAAGIGKTRVVQEIAKKAKSELVFDEIAIAVLSPNTDVFEVQGLIAAVMGVKFPDHANILVRAKCLQDRLADPRRILLMLDNVYEVLDIEEIGIPKVKSCKVVVASRKEDVLNEMGIYFFSIRDLSEEKDVNWPGFTHAWGLFTTIAGDYLYTNKEQSVIAREVANLCESVPRDIIKWGGKMRQCKDYAAADGLLSAMRSHLGFDSNSYSTIEENYNALVKDKTKSIFRLCCQFPKDEYIEIELLIRFSLGLERFRSKNITLVEARQGVLFSIRELIQCDLLELGGTEGLVRVSDIAWYVGRDKIAEQKQNDEYFLYASRSKEIPKDDMYNSRHTFPFYPEELHELPDMDLSGLKLLSYSCSHDRLEMPQNFFVGMKGLQILDFRINILKPLPRSLKFLSNLRTLYLDFCKLCDISLVGDLHRLEILSFFQSEMEVFPSRLKKLRMLKLLDLRCKIGPSLIHAGVLSKMKKLEELYTGNYFDPQTQNKCKGAKAEEIVLLCCLKALQISATIDDEFLKKFKTFEFKNLTEFEFSKFDVESLPVNRYHLSKKVELKEDCTVRSETDLKELMKKTQELKLDKAYWCRMKLEKTEFLNLRRLTLFHCLGILYDFHEEVSQDPEGVFLKLVSLDIMNMESD